MLPMEFHYLTEFQAHQPDFDYLKSIEIPERINSISWLQNCGSTHMLFSANDKQVKLWKVCATHGLHTEYQLACKDYHAAVFLGQQFYGSTLFQYCVLACCFPAKRLKVHVQDDEM